MNQHEAVVQALEKLGGIGTLGQLNQETMKIENCTWKTKTPFASIRRIVQTNKNIFKIKPGLYGLEKYRKTLEGKGIIQETNKNKNSKDVLEFNHYYYQGLLLTIGKLKGLNTFSPNQDKSKFFMNIELGKLRTLEMLPAFSYPILVQRSSTVDVIWFNERNMPHSFFEVEHSTDIQNSLLKFNDLQDFFTRMIIVADKSRKLEFENKIKYSSFKNLTQDKRVSFLDYEALSKQYENILMEQKFEVLL